MFLSFENVQGYATYDRASKRGSEHAAKVATWVGEKDAWRIRWVVIALPSGRFVPSFIVGDVIGPQFFIGATNICCMN